MRVHRDQNTYGDVKRGVSASARFLTLSLVPSHRLREPEVQYQPQTEMSLVLSAVGESRNGRSVDRVKSRLMYKNRTSRIENRHCGI